MALASTTLPTKSGLSLWCPSSPSLARRFPARFSPIGSRIASRSLVTASFANENREFVYIILPILILALMNFYAIDCVIVLGL
jgi:monodehydroascorbate reductase (NADH)